MLHFVAHRCCMVATYTQYQGQTTVVGLAYGVNHKLFFSLRQGGAFAGGAQHHKIIGSVCNLMLYNGSKGFSIYAVILFERGYQCGSGSYNFFHGYRINLFCAGNVSNR